MRDLARRFSFGINVDDSWRYTGFREPKSIIIPHLLSVSLPEGRVLESVDEELIREHGDVEPKTAAERASLSLAENLVDAKIDFVRCWFYWRFFEPALRPAEELERLFELSYAEWPTDGLVRILADHGIDIVPVLACGYQRMLPDGLSVDSSRDLYLKRASIHTRLLVRKYKDKIRFWQIENEPNWWREHAAAGWRSGSSWIDPHGFREQLLHTLNESVHAEDPNGRTIINLEADSKTIDPSYYAPFCDILGLDYYPNYRSSSPINTSVFKSADQIAKDVGKPVMISETGYPSGPGILGYSTLKQAEYVRSACNEAFGVDRVNGIGIWRYIDTSWRSFPDQENHFGLIDRHGNHKPAWAALIETIRKLK